IDAAPDEVERHVGAETDCAYPVGSPAVGPEKETVSTSFSHMQARLRVCPDVPHSQGRFRAKRLSKRRPTPPDWPTSAQGARDPPEPETAAFAGRSPRHPATGTRRLCRYDESARSRESAP